MYMKNLSEIDIFAEPLYLYEYRHWSSIRQPRIEENRVFFFNQMFSYKLLPRLFYVIG